MAVKVIAFDVNETLLDLSGLDGPFEEVLGDRSMRGQWFAQMLQLSFVGGLTGEYVDFTSAQRAAFLMIAQRTGVAVSEQDAVAMVDRMSALAPHPEVRPALSRLRDTSLRVVALTNSKQAVAEAQLTFAGIRDLFDDVFSADTVRKLKPSPEPYHHVAASCDVRIDQVRLVAAHAWDVAGALAAGCKAGFVQRPGMVLSPLGPQPDMVGPDLDQVINQILGGDHS
jgi:2-haloacid dehalogenase